MMRERLEVLVGSALGFFRTSGGMRRAVSRAMNQAFWLTTESTSSHECVLCS